MGSIIDFQRAVRRRAGVPAPRLDRSPLWSWQAWPLCRIRYFVRSQARRPPRCCCGHVYTEPFLRYRTRVVEGVVRTIVESLEREGRTSPAHLLAALRAHPGLTSVERAALSTGPCTDCTVIAERIRELQFLLGLYRAYWRQALPAGAPRRLQDPAIAAESRRSAADLRIHVRHEIGLIRRLRQMLAQCPWSRHRQAQRPTSRPSLGC